MNGGFGKLEIIQNPLKITLWSWNISELKICSDHHQRCTDNPVFRLSDILPSTSKTKQTYLHSLLCDIYLRYIYLRHIFNYHLSIIMCDIFYIAISWTLMLDLTSSGHVLTPLRLTLLVMFLLEMLLTVTTTLLCKDQWQPVVLSLKFCWHGCFLSGTLCL